MSLPIALTPGTVIGGHYIIGDLINRGGFGAVYRGTDTSEGNRPCAVKEIYDVTPAARRQALMEASVLFTIRSKHLPEVYDALEANGRFYLVMQLIEGQNLLQLLRSRVPGGLVGEQEPNKRKQGPCSEQEVLSWLLPIMDVLQELHSRNPPIMHRDIKPGNIILTPQQTAVLVDFGLTKLYDPSRSTQTMVKAVTEGFSPVEQYVGQTSPQSDIYSIAATMYLLLTNRLPPAALNRSMQDTLIAPRKLNPSLSPRIEQALLKALAVHATDRYQSMREFADALREPGFSAYADRTIATPPVTSASPQPKTPAKQQPAPQVPPVPTYTGSPQAPQTYPGAATGGYPSHPGYTGYSGSPQPSYVPQPGYMPNRTYPNLPAPRYGTMPQPAVQPLQPLPTSTGQGCLWGILGGITCALLVLFLHVDTAFIEALLLGGIFCMVAGYGTTHKGGAAVRGGWAGSWTGLIGFILFWITFYIGLIGITISFLLQAMNAHHPHLSIANAFQRAEQSLQLTWPGYPNSSSPLMSLLILAAIWLASAFALGWIGGTLGSQRYKARMARRARRAMKIAAQQGGGMPHP